MKKDITEFEQLFIRLEENNDYVSPYLLESVLELLERYNYEPTNKMWEVIENMREK